MSLFKAFLFTFILNLTVFGMGYGLICAADFELILGTSSAFNLVRGTTVAGGTSTIYVGSATVSINSNTQGAMLYIAGSSSANTDASLHVVNTSGTSTLYVRNDGNVGIGTTTPGTALYVIGTITATTGYIGDGSQLTGISATSVGANAVDSNQLVNTLNITDTTINVGSLTVSAGNFRVDSAGSMTATTITSTGSTTVSGTLTAANSTFRADTNFTYVTTRVGIGTTTPGSSYLMQVTSDGDTGVAIGSGGSITVKTLAVTGTATVTGTLTASNALRVDTSTLVVDATNNRVGIGTTTPQYTLQVNDGSGALGFVVDSTGSVTSAGTITAANFKAVGTVTANSFIGDGSQLTGVSATSIGANAVDSSQLVNTLNITDTTINVGSLTVSAGNFRVDTAGSMTATTITSTGSTTVSGTLTAANSTFRADTNFTYVTTRLGIGTTTPGSSYLLQVTNDGDTGVAIGSGGSITVKTLAVTGSATASTMSVTGTATIATTSGNVGIGTTTPSTLLTVGTTTNILNVLSTGNVGIGTTTPQHKLTVSGSMYSPRFTLSDASSLPGTITVNWNNGNVQFVAFNNLTSGGSRDIVLTNGQDGGKYILFLKQGSTATSTVSWPATSTVRWSGGGTGTALTGTVNKTDYFGFIYNGINSVYDSVAERLNF